MPKIVKKTIPEVLNSILDIKESKAKDGYQTSGPGDLNAYRCLMSGKTDSWLQKAKESSSDAKPKIILSNALLAERLITSTERSFLSELIKRYDVYIWPGENISLTQCKPLTSINELLEKKDTIVPATEKKIKSHSTEITQNYKIMDYDLYQKGIKEWTQQFANSQEDINEVLDQHDFTHLNLSNFTLTEKAQKDVLATVDTNIIKSISMLAPNDDEFEYILKNFPRAKNLYIHGATPKWIEEHSVQISLFSNVIFEPCFHTDLALTSRYSLTPAQYGEIDDPQRLNIPQILANMKAYKKPDIYYQAKPKQHFNTRDPKLTQVDAEDFLENLQAYSKEESLTFTEINDECLDELKKFKNLKRLTIKDHNIQHLDLALFPHLEELTLIGCLDLTTLSTAGAKNLRSLKIQNNTSIEYLDIDAPILETLEVKNVKNPDSINFKNTPNLKKCSLEAEKLTITGNAPQLEVLKTKSDFIFLDLPICNKLRTLEVAALTTNIHIREAESLRSANISNFEGNNKINNTSKDVQWSHNIHHAYKIREEIVKAKEQFDEIGEINLELLRREEDADDIIMRYQSKIEQSVNQANKTSRVASYEVNDEIAPDYDIGTIQTMSSQRSGNTVELYEQGKVDRNFYRISVADKIISTSNSLKFVSTRNELDYELIADETKAFNDDMRKTLKEEVDKNADLGVGNLSLTLDQHDKYYPIPNLYALEKNDLLKMYGNPPDSVSIYYHPEFKQFYLKLKDSVKSPLTVDFLYQYNRRPLYTQAFQGTPDVSNKTLLDDPLLIQRLNNELNNPNDPKLKDLQFIFDKTLSIETKMEKLYDYCYLFDDKGKPTSNPQNELESILSFIKERKGVCRHRSQAYMLLAHFMDVPVRMIESGSGDHAFCEVKKGGQWHQVDLGGGESNDLRHVQLNKFQQTAAKMKMLKTVVAAQQSQTPAHTPEEKNIVDKCASYIRSFVEVPELKTLDTIATKQTLSPLLEFSSADSLLKMRTILSERFKSDYLYIDNAEDFDAYLRPYTLINGKRSQIDGPLKTMISSDKESVIAINWSNFTATQLASYKSILDKQPTIKGNPVNPNVHIIGLNRPTAEICTAFSSRCQSYKVSSEFLESQKSNLEEKLSKDEIQPEEVDLFGRLDWEQKLLGDIKLNGHSVEMKEGALIKALLQNKPLVIYNKPDDEALDAFLDKIKAEKRIYFNGDWIDVPLNFNIRLETKTHEAEAKNIQVESHLDDDLPESGVHFFNQNNWHELFKITKYDSDHKATEIKGFLDEYKTPEIIYITDKISEADWKMLIENINSNYPDKEFRVIVGPQASVGNFSNNETVIFYNNPDHVFVSNDPDFKTDELHDRLGRKDTLVIDINEKTTYQDLIASVINSPQKDPSKVDFIYEEKDMLKALRKGRTVILNGKMSPSLYQHLLPLLSEKPHINLNGERLGPDKLRGMLYASMPLSAEKELNLHQYNKDTLTLENYKTKLGNNYPIAEKIQLFYELANALSHRGAGMPDKPVLTYQNIKRMTDAITKARGLHSHNPIKGLFLYDYPKHSNDYAYLNVIGKYLFNPDDTSPTNENKIRRLIRNLNTYSPYERQQNIWKLLNCYNGAELAKLFNNQPIESLLVRDQGFPTLPNDIIDAVIKKAYATSPLETKEENKSHVGKRENQLYTLITDPETPFILLKGEAGVGKTFTVNQLKDKYGFIIPEGKDFIEQWLTTKSDKPIILLLDEANMAQPGTWDFLKGLTRMSDDLEKRTIYYKGKEYELSPQHKVIATGNPESFPERYYHPLFQHYFETLHFKMPEDTYLLNEVIKPILAKTPFKDFGKGLLDAYKLIIKHNPTGVYSTRDLQNLALRFRTMLTDTTTLDQVPKKLYEACAIEFSGNIKNPEKRQEFLQELATSLHVPIPTQKLPIQLIEIKANKSLYVPDDRAFIVDGIKQDFKIRAEAIKSGNNYYYKQGILIEGEPGLGKSTLYEALLQEAGFKADATNPQEKYYVVSVGDESAHEILKKAFNEGSAVILDELNLDESLETLLNQLLTGRDENNKLPKNAGFMVLASQNPSTESGRKPVSKALLNRTHLIYMDPDSNEGLTAMGEKAGLQHPKLYKAGFDEVKKEFPDKANSRTYHVSIDGIVSKKQKETVSSHRNSLYAHSKPVINDPSFSNTPSHTPKAP